MQCKDCLFVFVEPRPSKQELNNYYRSFDYREANLAEPRIRSDARISMSFINKYISTEHSLLDMGCGRGYLLDEARKYGWKDIMGVDYSALVINYAKTKLNLNVVKRDLYRFKSKKRYELIILNQVIEHVLDINLIFDKIESLLAPKGFIYIATPNFSGASSKVFKTNFEHIIPPEHINYFSISNLVLLLEKHKYKIIGFGTWGYPENMAGIVKEILNRNSHAHSYNISVTPQSNISSKLNLKYLFFDNIFCKSTYKLLDLFNMGINIQILAQKK